MSATPTLQGAIDKGKPIKLVGDPLFYEPLAAAFDKQSSADSVPLAEAVSEIIEEMHADGTLSDMSMEWYEEDLTQSQHRVSGDPVTTTSARSWALWSDFRWRVRGFRSGSSWRLVWLVITALLAWLFLAAGFDLEWIRDKAKFVSEGIIWTVILSIGAIVLACIMALHWVAWAVCRRTRSSMGCPASTPRSSAGHR